MRLLRRFLARLKNFATGRRDDQRLREEMEEHLALQAEENLRAGMNAAEARRQAVMNFGGVGTVREDYHAEQSLPFFENLIQDLRYALRMFAKSPGFSAIAILTMALGIGATTAIFSLVDAELLHPLPYPHPEGLVRIEDDLPGAGATDAGIPIPEWKDLQHSGIFQYVVLQIFGSANLTGASQPSRMQYEGVSPAYFAMLGVKPELGQTFDRVAPDGRFALWRNAHRSSYICWRHPGADRCGACGLLYPRAAGNACRPDDRTEIRVVFRNPRCGSEFRGHSFGHSFLVTISNFLINDQRPYRAA
jgi:hypothetical protein